jgi:hypothetical protein
MAKDERFGCVALQYSFAAGTTVPSIIEHKMKNCHSEAFLRQQTKRANSSLLSNYYLLFVCFSL